MTGKSDDEPVEGPELRSVNWNEVIKDLPDKDRARFAKALTTVDPRFKETVKGRRRDRIRTVITILVFGAILAQTLVTLYLAAYKKSFSWEHVGKDWLTLSVAPLAAAAGVAAAFWFPTRESD